MSETSASIATIERLLADAELLPDPQARVLVKALAAALVDLVGDGLRRIGEVAGEGVMRQLADDELVGNLMVLSGQHPDAAALRAQRALEGAGKELGSIGIDHVTVEPALGGGIRVHARGERGTPLDEGRVRAMVEAIVVARAPDIEDIQLEVSGTKAVPTGFVPLERLRVIT